MPLGKDNIANMYEVQKKPRGDEASLLNVLYSRLGLWVHLLATGTCMGTNFKVNTTPHSVLVEEEQEEQGRKSTSRYMAGSGRSFTALGGRTEL